MSLNFLNLQVKSFYKSMELFYYLSWQTEISTPCLYFSNLYNQFQDAHKIPKASMTTNCFFDPKPFESKPLLSLNLFILFVTSPQF